MSFTLTTQGLLFSDDFNRADGAPGANYTTSNGPTATIVSNKLVLTGIGAEGRLRVIGPGTHTAAYAEAKITIPGSATDVGIVVLDDGSLPGAGAGQGYLLQSFGGQAQLFRLNTGYLLLGQTAFVPGNTVHRYGIFYGSNVQKTWIDGTAMVSDTNNSFTGGTTGYVGLRSTGSGISVHIDDLLIFRDYRIVVTGMPSGYKARIGGVTATESSGTATVDVGGVAPPFSTLEVLNASSVLVESLSGTFWPGSEFLYSILVSLSSAATVTYSISADLTSVDPTAVDSTTTVTYSFSASMDLIDPIFSAITAIFNFSGSATLTFDFGSSSEALFNFHAAMTAWIACLAPTEDWIPDPSDLLNIREDFRIYPALTRPEMWTRSGDQASEVWIWTIEDFFDGRPNFLKTGDSVFNGGKYAFINNRIDNQVLGKVWITFKHTLMAPGFGASSAGLGLSVVDRPGLLPSGLFIRGDINGVTSISVIPVWRDTDGMEYLPGGSFVLNFTSIPDIETEFTMELERISIDYIRWRAYPSSYVKPAWVVISIPEFLQGLEGSPAIYYNHNNATTSSIPRFETFSYDGVSTEEMSIGWEGESIPAGDWSYGN